MIFFLFPQAVKGKQQPDHIQSDRSTNLIRQNMNLCRIGKLLRTISLMCFTD